MEGLVNEGERQIRNLCLIGFMGVGKSTVGHLLADHLGFEFLDTDAHIERTLGKPIPRIFAEEGEAYFRACEAQVVQELAQRTGVVIATGGGLAANADHLASLKAHSLVVWLWASPELIWARVRHQHHRPLLQTPNPEVRIRELLAQREPVYRSADVLVNTELRSAREVAHYILSQFRLARSQGHP